MNRKPSPTAQKSSTTTLILAHPFFLYIIVSFGTDAEMTCS